MKSNDGPYLALVFLVIMACCFWAQNC